MAAGSQLVGQTLGHYRIVEQIGAGGMGVVFRAHDEQLERDVAIKVLPAGTLADEGTRSRFRKEALLLARLDHPNIATIYEFGTDHGLDFLVAALIPGSSLDAKLTATGALPEPEVVSLGLQLADGLAAAHAHGVVHRDLKPGNLRLTPDGRLKILDFGLARLVEPEGGLAVTATLTHSQEVTGTLPYMAPEQLRGEKVDARSDIWGVGAVLYELATGKRAFDRQVQTALADDILHKPPPPPSQVRPGLSARLEAVINRCLHKDPLQRYQLARELHLDLQKLSTGAVPLAARRRLWPIMTAAVVAVAILTVGALFYVRGGRPKLTEKDTIVLADFDNKTGDPIFDDTLKTALSVALNQSPFLNVLSENKVTTILKQMTRTPDTKLTAAIARELCQRSGSKAYIAGSIASLGTQYVLALNVVNCLTGDTLTQEQETALAKEKVLDALGAVASKVRGELGESLATVHKFDVPLREATTSSLEALKSYSLGLKAEREKGSAPALTYLQRSIELDPHFAMAHAALGNQYASLSEIGRATRYFTKAFQLRDNTSEGEKLTIAAEYYGYVTGELMKAVQMYEELIETYPRGAVSYINLGALLSEQAQYEKATEITKRGMQLDPNAVPPYENLANYMLALQHFNEARQVIHQAQARKVDDYLLHSALYTLAFFDSNSTAMAQQEQWFAGRPEENIGLSLASDTEAYAGHLGEARELTKRAADSAVRADSKENAAIWFENSALRETAFGNATDGRQAAAEGLKLMPGSQGVEVEAALAFAMVGDAAQAESRAQDLSKRFPLDTQMQSLWLPAIQAQLALNKKKPAEALTDLQATSAIELGVISFVANLSCLYPTYIRGEAYLAAGQGTQAAAEFKKILDHSGIVWNCWTGALARLGVARANALQARTIQGADADAARVRALGAYKDFLTLWRDADPDIPILKQAKAEYAKLE